MKLCHYNHQAIRPAFRETNADLRALHADRPGMYVRHVDYPSSFGIIIAHNGAPLDSSTKISWDEVTVLWSNPPPEFVIETQEIKSTSRRLKVGWSVESR